MDHQKNLRTIETELNWLNACIEYRFMEYFQQTELPDPPKVPEIDPNDGRYAALIDRFQLSTSQRLALIIALAPHLRPSIFDLFYTKNKLTDKVYTEFGGVFTQDRGGFIPTGETLAFIISGSDLSGRLEIAEILSEDGLLCKQNWIRLGDRKANAPIWSSEIALTDEFRVQIIEGKEFTPTFSPSFPAQLIESSLDWHDAIFPESVRKEIHMIESWLRNEKEIMEEWGLRKYLKKGYRALFYGPPGTGKSLAASLLGKSTKRKVFRVDLSSVISKYIGETEKNLAQLFNKAEHKQWILFFDEADALFSKRTNTSSSNDVFANQQVAYLLQRIEDYNGLVILASNFKDNMDDAFLRRFQSLVHFPKPDTADRLRLWKQYFDGFEIVDLSLEELAENYELTGGSLVNVLRFCAQHAAERGSKKLDSQMILHAIRRELKKEGAVN